MNYFSHHTHSQYCDGKGNPEDFITEALKKGFHTLGFSSHAPVPFKNNFAISDEAELQDYCSAIRKLQKKYAGKISVYLALEIDYIEGICGDFDHFRKECGLDYVIGSVHLVRNGDDERLWFIDGPKVESYDDGLRNIFGGNIRKAVTAYFDQEIDMITTQKPDIVGHFDKIKMHNNDRYFREDEQWYRDLVMDLLDVIENTGVIAEVNTRGIYKKRSRDLYPGQWILKILKDKNIPITLSSDAHKPEEIDGYYAETIKILKEIGYKSLVFFNEGKWQEIGF